MTPLQFGLSPLHDYLKKSSYSSCAILSSQNIFSLYGQELCRHIPNQLPNYPIFVPSGEDAKTLQSASQCWEKMHANGLDRKSLIICLGGGTITDLGGYVAGSYMRGIDLLHVPTSLMGMVDAAIGGKCAVNLPSGKNLVGLFYQPKLIVFSPHYLKTLSDREMISGLAEVIKYGVIQDPQLFSFLETHMAAILKRDSDVLQQIIETSYRIKSNIVVQDEREGGLRAILNWGHTFAHALEAMTNYSQYSHGEAVSIGMNCAASVSHALGIVDKEFVERQRNLCLLAGLPIGLPNRLDIESFIQRMKGDKKSVGNKITLILAKGFGKVEKVHDVDPELIRKTLLSLIVPLPVPLPLPLPLPEKK